MSVFDFEGGSGSGRNWNYSRPEEDDFETMITGDVIQLSEVQSINFGTKQPETWPDGNPKLNVCMTIMRADGGEVDWTFSPGGRGDKASNAMKAVRQAIVQAGMPGKSLTEIAGLNITVATQQGVYNNANPRPWGVQINGHGSNQYRGTKKFEPRQQQAQAPQQPKPPMQMPPMQAAQASIGQQQVMQAAMRARDASMQFNDQLSAGQITPAMLQEAQSLPNPGFYNPEM